MKKTSILILAALTGIMVGCKPSREKTVTQIQGLEKRLFSPDVVSFDKSKADSLIAMYEEFVKTNPEDSLSPVYLFKAANIEMNNTNGKKALDLFDQVLQNYPGYSKAPLCLFFKGFVYENVMHDLDKAREIYLLFIEKYPTNGFTKDARLALKNLGKTPDMIIREFEAQNHADSLRIADSLVKARKNKKQK